MVSALEALLDDVAYVAERRARIRDQHRSATHDLYAAIDAAQRAGASWHRIVSAIPGATATGTKCSLSRWRARQRQSRSAHARLKFERERRAVGEQSASAVQRE